MAPHYIPAIQAQPAGHPLPPHPEHDTTPALSLRHGEDRRLRSGHLWVFSNEVDIRKTPLTGFAPGDRVRVMSDRDQFLGHAYVNPATLIAARIVSRSEGHPISRGLLKDRLRSALALRETFSATPHYRWVFGESDGLPGLVLDRYGDVVVGQIATVGMERLRPDVEAAVRAVLEAAGITDILTKSQRSSNPFNVVYATIVALQTLRTREEIAKMRNKEVSQI